ncbi:MAG: bifunctional 4-hydroxy-2-oxoglutarate aldolase/2-dehydro-3-deoxy-phosphogluconate aldolase [Chitinophagaceae bacterium]
MDREQQIKDLIKQQGFLPLFYHDDIETCIGVTRALYDAGVRFIEFTNRGPMALQNFKQLVQLRDKDWKDLILAVGTIKTAEHASQFIDAGADFLISPFFDHAVCDVAYLQKTGWIPGCMTPAEIQVAEQAGCSMIKLFPGNTMGPSFMEAIKPLFPKLDFVVTGGVDTSEENIRKWFEAGVCAVGMGSNLVSKLILDRKDFDSLHTSTKAAIATIKAIQSDI